MRSILAVIPLALLLSSCDRDPTLPPTTPERPARLTYAWAFLEGTITVKEDPYNGDFTIICPSGSLTTQSRGGTYSILLRLERNVAAGPTEVCRIDVGNPVIFSRTSEVPVAARADAVVMTRFDAILLPDAPPMAHMEAPIISVAAAGGHTCAVSATGAAYCWGLNRDGELGFGSHLPTLYPARVQTSETFASIAASGYVRNTDSGPFVEESGSCALRTDGAVFCWGDRMRAAVDSSVTEKAALVPQRVAHLPPVASLTGGQAKVCGITQSRDLYCWGGYYYAFPPAFQRINVSDVIDVDNSGWHSCALEQTGRWHCWGLSDQWGERGDSSVAYPFKRIAVGSFFTCALDQDGLAWCWGRNNLGQLGRGDLTVECKSYDGYPRMCPGTDVAPKRVLTDIRFTDIDAGQNHACGLSVDNVVYCWGGGSEGQIGNGSTANRAIPVPVLGQTGLHFTKLSVGDLHTCGIATDRRLYCWGQGKYGQLGTNSTDNQPLPVAVWGQ